MTRSIGSALRALLTGAALGLCASVASAFLLYTGQGFLAAAAFLISLAIAALGAGLWGGWPELNAPISLRVRWAVFATTLALAGVYVANSAAAWMNAAGSPIATGTPLGNAFAALILLAAPGYAAGALLAGLFAADARAHVGPAAALGAAAGVLLAGSVAIPRYDAAIIFISAAMLVAAVGLLGAGQAQRTSTEGQTMLGKVVLVTGVGERGQLGFAIARRFVAAGARVIITARADVSDLAAELAGSTIALRADLTVDRDVAALLDAVQNQYGRLDALINAVGGLSVVKTVNETTAQDLLAEYERNAGTVLRVTRAALPLLRAQGGAIVNFTSPAAHRAPARLAAYAAAKAGVVALTRSLAIEERDAGVRVNAIAPGMVDTEQNRQSEPERTRWVTREEIAEAALFLASDAARGITGSTVDVLGRTIA